MLTWQDQKYDVPEVEPAQARDLDGLHYFFRVPLESYVDFARNHTGLDIRIGECRRSRERQVWLLSQGRVNSNRIRSWTLDSFHRVGLAADLFIINAEGAADWNPETWRTLYAEVPPQWFGLTPIKAEWVHLEHMSAGQIAQRAADFYVVRT